MYFLLILAVLICGLDGSELAQQQNMSNSYDTIPHDAKVNMARYLGACNGGGLQQSSTKNAAIVQAARLKQIRSDYQQLIENTAITAEQLIEKQLIENTFPDVRCSEGGHSHPAVEGDSIASLCFGARSSRCR